VVAFRQSAYCLLLTAYCLLRFQIILNRNGASASTCAIATVK
jgi:hypothetical protein